MPNAARHVLGVIAGFVFTPVLAGALVFGTEHLAPAFVHAFLNQPNYLNQPDYLVAGAALLVVGAVAGVLAGSRMSPLASLIPGVVFTAVGVLWAVTPTFVVEHMPLRFHHGHSLFGAYGLCLTLGMLLLVASAFPARWAGRPVQPADTTSGQLDGTPPSLGSVPALASDRPAQSAEQSSEQSDVPPLPRRRRGQSGHSTRHISSFEQPPASYRPEQPPAAVPASEQPSSAEAGGGDGDGGHVRAETHGPDDEDANNVVADRSGKPDDKPDHKPDDKPDKGDGDDEQS